MSSLRVNRIVNLNDDGPVEFSKGVQVPAGIQVDEFVINAVGVVTATAFYGIGIGITTFGVANEVSSSKAIAYTIIG
jgi:hypothetical protein